jgi:hypothetical protein
MTYREIRQMIEGLLVCLVCFLEVVQHQKAMT